MIKEKMNKEKIISTDCCASPGLISVDKAIEHILAMAEAVSEIENIIIEDSCSRILAEDIYADINVPGYDNSAMDGYAVRSAEVSARGVLPVTQRIPAGSIGEPLRKGTAARIFTGAPVPPGADAVVMQEKCTAGDDEVTINSKVKAGTNIRRAGEDIAAGNRVLKSGKRIRPQEMGLLASVGVASIKVKRRLKVAIFFTGDELVNPGQTLQAGQIYNSNKYTITGYLQALDTEIIDLGIVPDTLDDTLRVLKTAAEAADLVITSGGVSVGEEDYVRLALEELGELFMWRIAMKPGKPVAFGRVFRDDSSQALFMGLPGNPVSVFVTGVLFARPLILTMQGASTVQPCKVIAIADFNWPGSSRQEYLRVHVETVNNEPVASLYPHQGSGVLSSVSWADGLAEVAEGQDISPGDSIAFIPFQGLF